MAFVSIPEHPPAPETCEYLVERGHCYWCCPSCNYDRHQCPGCGTPLNHRGEEAGNRPHPPCT